MNLSGDVGDLISVDHFRTVWLFHLPSSPTLFLFFPQLPSSLTFSLCEQASWPDSRAQLHLQLCVGPQQTLLFISLIGHIWRHYFHLCAVRWGAGKGELGLDPHRGMALDVRL